MSKEKVSYKKTLIAGIISENPVFVSLLGMCPTLATTKSIEGAFGMGILVILTLLGSNLLISLLRNVIPSQVKIPCYIVIIATFVTIIKMLCQAYVPALYDSLGVFISLIVVNCIILGRAESFASKNGPVASIFDAIGSGIGFTLAICVIAFFREIIGTGAITIGEYLPLGFKVVFHLIPQEYAISLFVQSAGGFLTLGSVLAFLGWIKNRKEEKAQIAEKKRIEELKAKKAQEVALKKAAEEKAKAEALSKEAQAETQKEPEVEKTTAEASVANPEVKEAI